MSDSARYDEVVQMQMSDGARWSGNMQAIDGAA